MKKTKITLRDEKGNTKEQDIRIDEEGGFVAVVNVEDVKGDALLEIETEGGAYNSLKITEENMLETVLEDKEILVNKVEKGQAYTLNDILFQTNSSELVESSKIVLDGFSDWLIKNTNISVEIQGHTDNIGAEKANMALSMDRAFTVMEYLLCKDIDPKRLKFKGYGESMPKFSNASAEGRASNRRTDFYVF